MYNPEDDINLLDTENESLNPDVDSSEAKLAKLIKQKQMLDLINPKVNMPNLNVESNNQQQVNNNVPELNQTQLQDLQSSYLDPREYLASVGSKLPVRKDEAPLDKPTGPIVPKDKSIVQKDTKQLSDELPIVLPTDTYSNKLVELQDRANRMASLMDLGRAMSAASATMVGAKESAIDRPLQAMKESIEATPKQFIELKEQEKNDPNSDVSKQYRAIAAKMGYGKETANSSAANIEKMFPQLATMFTAKEAAKARAELAKENREARLQEFQLKLASIAGDKTKSKQEREDKFVQSLRKEATSGGLKPMYDNYNTALRMKEALGEFKKDPGAYTDYATLMGGLKALQGDQSVVREAEMRLGMGATSLANKVKNWTNRIITGESLQPSQRNEMIKTVNILSEVARKQYVNAVQPIMRQAKKLSIDPQLILSEETFEEPGQKQMQVSSSTQQLINSRSEEENKKRLLELKQKYKR